MNTIFLSLIAGKENSPRGVGDSLTGQFALYFGWNCVPNRKGMGHSVGDFGASRSAICEPGRRRQHDREIRHQAVAVCNRSRRTG